MTTPRFPNLVDAVQAHAADDRPSLTWLRDGETVETTWTSADLARRARAVAVMLLQRARPGDRALLLVQPGLDFVAAYLGCLHAGLVAVPTCPPNYRHGSRSVHRFRALVADSRPAVIVTTREDSARAWFFASREAGLGSLAWATCDAVDLDAAGEWRRPEIGGESLAFLQYTSGSTAEPRGVAVSHGNLVANQEAIAAAFGLDRSSTCVSWLPPFHDMGLIGTILQPLYVGFPVVLMSPQDFLRRPARWLRAVSQHGGTISGGPDSAFALCTREVRDDELEGVDLRSWDVAFNGSETVRERTLREFAERFRPHGFVDAFHPCYGLAEATLLVAARRHLVTDAAPAPGDAVSVGAPVPGHEIAVVDPESGERLGEDGVGEIWVAGDSVTSGYWRHDDEEATSSGARLPGDLRRWLRTGDLGSVRAGELRVSGRLKDLLVVAGRNHHPQDLELTASACHEAIQPDACAAFAAGGDGDVRLVIAAEIRRTARRGLDVAAVESAVRSALGAEHDLAVHRVVLLPPASLSRTTSGKIRRHACREAFLAESWSPLRSSTSSPSAAAPAPRDRAPVETLLRTLVADLVQRDVASIDSSSDLARLGVDSLLRVELLMSLESRLGRRLPVELLDGQRSLSEMAQLLERGPSVEGASPAPARGAVPPEPGAELPLAPVQRDYLESGVDPRRFGVFVYLRTPPDLDAGCLERAVASLDRVHDALRLRFHRDAQGWHQTLAPAGPGVGFSRIDARGVTEAVGLRKIRLAARESLSDDIDLERGPLLRAAWVDRGPGLASVLYVHCHHLVADATAVRVLLGTLREQYGRALRGESLAIAANGPGYADWLSRLATLATSGSLRSASERWLATLPPATGPRPSAEPARPRRRPRSSLPAALAGPFLERLPTARDQHDALLASFLGAIADVTGERDLLVELESHGRAPLEELRAERLVGWCVHRHPLRVELADGADVESSLERVREAVARVPADGRGFGLLPEEQRRRVAEPRFGMSYRSRIDDPFRAEACLPVLDWQPGHGMQEAEPPFRRDLKLDAGRRGGELWWELIVDPEAFGDDQVGAIERRLAERLAELSAGLARSPARTCSASPGSSTTWVAACWRTFSPTPWKASACRAPRSTPTATRGTHHSIPGGDC